MPNGVVMLAGDGRSTRIIYHGLKDAVPISRVILELGMSRVALVRHRRKALGAWRVFGQVLFMTLVVPLLKRAARKRDKELIASLHLDESPIDEALITRVPSVNSAEAIQALKQPDPGVVLVNGTRIIGKHVLQSVGCRFINMHAGITPMFRGVHGAYWALAEGQPDQCGVTVHLVDEGIDTGNILGQALIEPTDRDNFTTYQLLQTAAGLPILRNAIRAALEGHVQALAPPEGQSRLWSHPTLWEYLGRRIASGIK